jgi:ribosomal protein S14
MKKGRYHDIKRRKLFGNGMGNIWTIHKALYRSKLVDSDKRIYAHKVLRDIMSNACTPNIIVKYCVLTGSSRSVIGTFRRNRHIVREMAIYGKLPGVRKASW